MPDPFLVSVSAALAGKAAVGLYELVKRKFAGRRDDTVALVAAEATPTDPTRIQALAERLELAGNSDPQFAKELRVEWEKIAGPRQSGINAVSNQTYGKVEGNVVQAGTINGGVTFS